MCSIFVAVFTVLAILAWADQDNDDIYQLWASPIQMGSLVIGIVVSWLFGRPFTMDYVREKLEPYKLDHPVVLHVARMICGMWLGIFLASFICGVIGASVANNSKTFVLLFVHPALLQILLLVAGMIATGRVQKWRTDNKDQLNAKFAPQIKAWKLKHPEVFGSLEINDPPMAHAV